MSVAQSTSRPLAELVGVRRSTMNPAHLGGESVQHYSIPAFDSGMEPDVVAASEIRSNKIQLAGPAVLVSKINPHIPRCWLVEPDSSSPALASTEFLPLVPGDATDLGYLFAACSSAPFQRSLASLVTGTSSSHQRVKPRDCLSLPIPVATESDQRRIGSTFRALDQRLRVARRVSATVNRLIAASFRHHFGSGAGGAQLAEVANVNFGVSYRSQDLNGDEQALVTLKSFGRSGEYRTAGLKAWSGAPKPEQIVTEGDVIVAQTDLTQAADVLGRCVVVRGSTDYARLVASLDVAILRPTSGIGREFLYGLSSQPEFRTYCRSRANGTTVLHLSRRAIPEYGLQVPTEHAHADYLEDVRPMLSRMLLADRQEALLVRMRRAFILEEFGS